MLGGYPSSPSALETSTASTISLVAVGCWTRRSTRESGCCRCGTTTFYSVGGALEWWSAGACLECRRQEKDTQHTCVAACRSIKFGRVPGTRLRRERGCNCDGDGLLLARHLQQIWACWLLDRNILVCRPTSSLLVWIALDADCSYVTKSRTTRHDNVPENS